MRRIGETFDTITAFCGAAVAGVTLLLPLTYTWSGESASYRVAALYASVPRGATVGVVVAVTVAVLIHTFARPRVAWNTALAGASGLLINHLVGTDVSAPDLLTTRNYVDSICGGLLLGALGAAVLRRPLPAFGFALGSVGFFVFGDFAELLHIRVQTPYTVLQTPPRWLILTALVSIALSAIRNSSPARQAREPGEQSELPIAPIISIMLFGLMVIAGTEWLTRQYDRPGGHTMDIAMAAGATVIAATVAAMLLPRRDGAGLLLAASLVPAAESMGATPRPLWILVAILVAAGFGIVGGLAAPMPSFGLFLTGVLAVYSIAVAGHGNIVLHGIGGIGLALVAGYCCGAAKPRYVPSGVLALGALFLPSVVSALPEAGELPTRDATAGVGTSGRTAMVITLGCAVGLAVLYRYRPLTRANVAAAAPAGAVADI
ncbi:hypothetical protein [Nocardia bovistercoris]|uniref:Uncharacterized protein n=1 Tax=Nocardia bovistercoris TaxID=2785916 RepID=A0A931IB63_9NOCA|nr:hypothetical protein [Nocardia bovistercoris]MBH0778199.1 hypothetical protein [Nocardia bovistercoris]